MPSPEPGAFKNWSRPKPHMVPILEAAIDPHLRVAALRALAVFRMPRPRELRQRFLSQVAISLGRASAVGQATSAHVCSELRPTIAALRQTQVKVPFIYAPAESVASTSARGPWEGSRYRLSCSVLGGGHSALEEAARAAGLRRAHSTSGWRDLQGGEVDPVDVPWAHVMIARSSPLHHATKPSDSVRFDAAGATLRSVLAVAAQRPWCAVFDFATAFRAAQGGEEWRLFEGMLHELGYVVDSVVLCPAVCLEATWAGARVPLHGCQGT